LNEKKGGHGRLFLLGQCQWPVCHFERSEESSDLSGRKGASGFL
jgi:hypothetical protein